MLIVNSLLVIQSLPAEYDKTKTNLLNKLEEAGFENLSNTATKLNLNFII